MAYRHALGCQRFFPGDGLVIFGPVLIPVDLVLIGGCSCRIMSLYEASSVFAPPRIRSMRANWMIIELLNLQPDGPAVWQSL